MKIVGMARVKNQGEFVGKMTESMDKLCSDIVILEDGSTDHTREVIWSTVKKARLHLLPTPFLGLPPHGVRDKNYLMAHVLIHEPDWVICLDGDEELSEAAIDALSPIIHEPAKQLTVISFKSLTFWNDYHTIRTDGWYNDLHVRRVFSIPEWFYHQHTWFSGYENGLHCGCTPTVDYDPVETSLTEPLLHYGYLYKEQRLHKYAFYRGIDPENELEDNYRHMVIGDLPEFPIDFVAKHGGPLKLEYWQ